MNRSEKLEQALRLCMGQMCKFCLAEAQHKSTKLKAVCENGCETLRIAKEALEKPPRNCDVGTADEQAIRFDQFCEERDCVKCPAHNLWHHYFDLCKNQHVTCGLIFEQMPYEQEEGRNEEK